MATRLNRLYNPLYILIRNPVALKELRGRMRGPRAFMVMTGYLLIVGFFTTFIYLAATSDSLSNTGEIDGGEVGRILFSSVVAIELFLVVFITPAFTASAISGEHEHQTYDLLRTTLLPESSLVWGKLFSALAYIILLLLAAIPMQSIAFLFGGVDLPEIYISFVILMCTAVFLGSLGIYFSSTTRSTLRANILTYITAMAVALISALIIVVLVGINNSYTATTNTSVVTRAGEWILLIPRGLFICLNPLATLLVTRDFLINQQSVFTIEYAFQDGTSVTLLSPWLVFSFIYLTMAGIILWRTVHILKRIQE
ncbi:MAG: hypothetical protein CUN55_06430 [Phototrophicales bacterium]|nr:MAG: hypothetical protein CUN55_06430 [Phototrophicales bacterium]